LQQQILGFPILSYGIVDMSSKLLNHYGSKKNWNATCKDIYSNMSKSFFKIGSTPALVAHKKSH